MLHRHLHLLTAVAALSFGATGALAAAPSPLGPPTMTGPDRSTLQKLHDADQLEIQMGNLAEAKGSTRDMRAFGHRLAADHTLTERKVDAFLRKRGTDISALASTTSADPDHEMLATKSGVAFDRAFAQQIVSDHQKLGDVLDSASVETADDTLRALYQELTTVVRAHKRAAEDLLAASARS